MVVWDITTVQQTRQKHNVSALRYAAHNLWRHEYGSISCSIEPGITLALFSTSESCTYICTYNVQCPPKTESEAWAVAKWDEIKTEDVVLLEDTGKLICFRHSLSNSNGISNT